jgi:hypothetical protein
MQMTWKTIRLELASTANFPSGSPGRAFLLRIPLNSEGIIDAERLAQHPVRATGRRFWASEPDQFGHLEKVDGNYVLRCQGGRTEELIRIPASVPLLLNREVSIEGPRGIVNRFRVASVKDDARR